MLKKMKSLRKKEEKPPELEAGQVSDLTKKTKFNPEQIQKIYREFMGENPDGKMTPEKLKKTYKQMFPDCDETTFADFVFKTYDSNHDGTVDFKEFITAVSLTKKGTLRQRLTWIFNIYDADNSGYITKKEMVAVLTSIGALAPCVPGVGPLSPKEKVDRIFQEMDRNKDNYLSLKEFIEGARRSPQLEVLLNNNGHVNNSIHKF